MDTIQLVGICAGVCTAVSLLPQLIRIIRNKKADDVSIVMLLILLTGLALWIVYGIMKKDWPIIITNCFSFLLNCVTTFLRVKYSGTK